MFCIIIVQYGRINGEYIMNIIIVGCGKVGRTLTEEFSSEGNHDITVIDLDRTKLQNLANTYDVMGVAGNGTSFSILQEAGIRLCP